MLIQSDGRWDLIGNECTGPAVRRVLLDAGALTEGPGDPEGSRAAPNTSPESAASAFR